MGKYFTERERYMLEVMLQDGISKKEISRRLGKCYQTIYNEIARGTIFLKDKMWQDVKYYKADVAQRNFEMAQTGKGRNYKIGSDFKLVDFIEDKIINEKYSPAAVLGYIKVNDLKFDTSFCVTTLYNYIHNGLFLNLSKKNLLRYKKKRTDQEVVRVAKHNILCKSIEDRSKEIMQRNDFGHWEMDTVVSGHDGKGALLVLSERKTRTELVYKMAAKSQTEVKRILDQIEKGLKCDFRDVFKTITVDNGVEFLAHEQIAASALSDQRRTDVYFCHPFSSWERGTNENINKMIRRWIPKGADISKYTDRDIERVMNWVNNYPRKIFDYRSSYQMLLQEGVQLI